MKKILKIYIDAYSGLSKESWMLAIVMLLNRMGSMVLPFLGIYLISELDFSLEQSGIVLSCYGIGAVLGSWLGGWITDKIGNFKVQALSLFLSAPLFLILPYFSTVLSFSMLFIRVCISVTSMKHSELAMLPSSSSAWEEYILKSLSPILTIWLLRCSL